MIEDFHLQEKIMRVPYGPNKEYFIYSLFLVFCNRITTSAVSAGVLLVLPIILVYVWFRHCIGFIMYKPSVNVSFHTYHTAQECIFIWKNLLPQGLTFITKEFDDCWSIHWAESDTTTSFLCSLFTFFTSGK